MMGWRKHRDWLLLHAMAAILVLVIFAMAQAWATDVAASADAGHAFVEDKCAGCHEVAQGAPPLATRVGPKFIDLANNAEATEFRLRVFLPHREVMPNFIFTDQGTSDIIAYILSLRD